ncbi:MAG: hypothetical protein KDK45_23950, partial [Leptospiraceae bacterium]|nr:hypothetical protein [Leptospiraceae bacterium]
MDFPQASVDRAREIAHLYSMRNQTKWGKSIFLYEGKFLELHYGFGDAIKRGVCGTYLHEAQREVDCFSNAGILYLVARETGLNPRIYWATNMHDYEIGEEERGGEEFADHAFITVQANRKELVLDRNYNLFGVVESKALEWIISKEGKKEKEVKRKFSAIRELEEEEYLALMEKNRKAENGKNVLRGGQKVHSRGKRVTLQYFPEKRELAVFIPTIYFPRLNEDALEGSETYVRALCSNIGNNGRILDEEATYRTFRCTSSAWTLDQFNGVFRDIELPVELVKEYIEHLRIAALHFGRKTLLEKYSTKDQILYFGKLGFSSDGKITKENGVNKKKHRQLLERIYSHFPLNKEPEYARDQVNNAAVYSHGREKAKSEKNPNGYLYTSTEHEREIAELLELVEEDIRTKFEVLLEHIKTEAGYLKGIKQMNRRVEYILRKKGTAERFRALLPERRKDPTYFYGTIDEYLFYKE